MACFRGILLIATVRAEYASITRRGQVEHAMLACLESPARGEELTAKLGDPVARGMAARHVA